MHYSTQVILLFVLALIAGELTTIASNTTSLYSLVHLSSIDASLSVIAEKK